jgi:hypothetical protein
VGESESVRWITRELIVDFAAVGDPGYADQFGRIVDDVHDAPVADTDAPLVFIAFEFLAASRSPIARDSSL